MSEAVGAPWSTEVALRDDQVDYLGHVTAHCYLELLEFAHWRWLSEVMADERPAFVIAEIRLRFLKELLIGDGPVSITIAPKVLAERSVTVVEELRSAVGRHATAEAVLVRWDPDVRGSRPFGPDERARIRVQIAPP
ncbi:acyl-CoA thioesterase [Amycolatopsis sp. cg13]|uniref:acyl-CoA thioesterase n=1 Tax=Amycolatopsis sp. cg13 TaxID=3238807 RepID=UPI0035261B1F